MDRSSSAGGSRADPPELRCNGSDGASSDDGCELLYESRRTSNRQSLSSDECGRSEGCERAGVLGVRCSDDFVELLLPLLPTLLGTEIEMLGRLLLVVVVVVVVVMEREGGTVNVGVGMVIGIRGGVSSFEDGMVEAGKPGSYRDAPRSRASTCRDRGGTIGLGTRNGVVIGRSAARAVGRSGTDEKLGRCLRPDPPTSLNAKPTTAPLTLRATSESVSLFVECSDVRHTCHLERAGAAASTGSGNRVCAFSGSCGDADSGQSSVSGDGSRSALAAKGWETR